jgi:hypothetical protein
MTSEQHAPDGAAVSQAGGPGQVDQARGLLGFLVAGFAAVLSFLGIRSAELSAILRNRESLVGYVAIAFFLSILAAVISIYAPARRGREPSWPLAPGVASLLLVAAAGAFLSASIQIRLVTTQAQEDVTYTVAGVVAVAAVAVFLAGLGPWRNRTMDRQLYFILLSVLLLAVGGYTALRIESANQDAPFTQFSAKVTASGAGTAEVSVAVDSAKVPAQDRVDVYVYGVPRKASIAGLCQGVTVPSGGFPCGLDPCQYVPCASLGVWQLTPDASGDIRQSIDFPLTLSAYQRINISDQVCQRAAPMGSCAPGPLAGSHLDVQLPPETSAAQP